MVDAKHDPTGYLTTVSGPVVSTTPWRNVIDTCHVAIMKTSPALARRTSLIIAAVALFAIVRSGMAEVPTVEVPVEAWAKWHGTQIEGAEAETTAVALDARDNVIVTGHAFGFWYTAKYASTNGELLWERHGPPGNAIAVAVDAGGNAIVIGSSNIMKHAAADGAVLWEQRFNGNATNDAVAATATAMALDHQGNVAVTGSAGGSLQHSGLYTAIYAASNGVLLWERRMDGPASSRAGGSAIAVDSYGNVLVTGSSGPVDEQYTAKYEAADGRLLWEQRQPGGAGQLLALSANDDVVTIGYDISEGKRSMNKYAADTGALIWSVPQANSNNATRGEARAMALDSRGNVVVVGTMIWPRCSGGDITVALNTGSFVEKYASADGALLWRCEDLPCLNTEGGAAVVIDHHDDVIVLRADFHTSKYAGRDGTVLWETRNTGSDSLENERTSSNRCLAVAVDGSVVITGGADGTHGRGGVVKPKASTAVKYVMTQVTYPTPITIALSMDYLHDCRNLRFDGDVGRTYRLQRAANPSGPWGTIALLKADSTGAVDRSDCWPSYYLPLFYRVVAP